MQKTIEHDIAQVFKTTLGGYKRIIDQDVEKFTRQLIAQTGEQFGLHSAESMNVFCDVLSRNGKRIRGALTMLAYEMYGGTNENVAIEAARVMELIQTYLLIVDDVHDRSRTRRGAPSAHVMLEEIHSSNHWKDDQRHFGESIAFNCSLIGSHIAMTIASDLDVEPVVAVKALKILNTNLQVTGEGQANDIFNEVTQTSSEAQVENVLVWKTAYYTFVNPLQFGAVLAGASDDELNRLREYSLAAGRAFQITDDILGTFGSEFESGKSPLDDLREGKRTLLMIHALKNADKEDAYFLERMLGKQDLTQTEFVKAKEIIFKAGSLDYTKQEAQKSRDDAVLCVDRYWSQDYPKQSEFLKSLVSYLLVRKS